MAESYDSDPPEEIGGVPVDDNIGGLPPVDEGDSLPPIQGVPGDSADYDYGEPVEPRIPQKRKAKFYQHDSGKKSWRWPFLMVLGCGLFCCACWGLCCGAAAALGGAAAVMTENEATETGTLERTIEATDTVITLSADNPTGRVRVIPGDSEQVRVEYTKKAYGFTMGQSQSGLEDISVMLENVGGPDQFVITAKKADGPLHFLDHVDMTVYVPQNVHLVIDTNTGEIDVQEGVIVHSMDLKTKTGAITFSGTLKQDVDARFSLETNTGVVLVKLPYDIYVRIDASTDAGGVDVASGFSDMAVEREDTDGPSQSWLGTLGVGSETAPRLTLHSDTGAIVVEMR